MQAEAFVVAHNWHLAVLLFSYPTEATQCRKLFPNGIRGACAHHEVGRWKSNSVAAEGAVERPHTVRHRKQD